LLDLIQSISVQDVEHSYLYTDALIHIVEIYENLFNINDYSELIHKKDIENIEYFLQKVLSHQVIQSIDCLKNITISCQELFDQIKQ
jgi:predicted MarR family transcription regulator